MKERIAIKQDEAEKAYAVMKGGDAIVIPTRVGYIIGGNTEKALKKMFDLKQRPLNKPGVVLTRFDMLDELAEVDERYWPFIKEIEKRKLLLGSILRRKKHPMFDSVDEFAQANSRKHDNTSCFVINAGEYCQYISDRALEDGKMFIASSANKSGTGNERKFEQIPENIRNGVGYALEHDEFVAQEHIDPDAREQGVMIDLTGKFPLVTRRGFEYEQIESIMHEFLA